MHVGDTITVPVWVNVTDGYVNAADVTVDYPTNLLMAQQFTADSATWPSVISSGLSSGQAEIQVGNWGAEGADHDLGVNGQLLIGTLTLKAAAAGNATVSVDPDSLIAVTTLNDQTLTSSAPISYQILPLTRCERGRRFCDALLARVLR